MLSKKQYNRKSIEKQLMSLGFSPTQAAVYLAILKLKKTTVLQISRETGIQRPTIYDCIAFLENSALVTHGAEGSKKFILPEKPNNLLTLIEQKHTLAKGLLSPLTTLYQTNQPEPPKIRFFQGEEGLKKLTNVILTSKDKTIRTLASYEENIKKPFTETFQKNLWNARAQKHIFGHILYTQKDIPFLSQSRDHGETGNIRYNREVRILPPEINLDILYTIVDDNVLFWSSKEEGYSFHIQSPSYANSLKSLFDFLWAQSEKFPKK